MRFAEVAVDCITVRDRHREPQEDKIAAIAESMDKIGLQSPISVKITDHDDGSFDVVLVAGLHRLKAAQRLGWAEIPAFEVELDDREQRMWEISENLHRAELSALERDEQIAEWIDLAKAVSRQVDAKPGRPESGRRAAAREIGISEPDARRAEKVAGLSEEAKTAAIEEGLDDNRSALLKAAREKSPEEQVEAIRSHGKPVAPPPDQLNPVEVSNKYRTALMNAWNRAPKEDREWFLAEVHKPVMDGGCW